MPSITASDITSRTRGIMKVYAARDYVDTAFRKDKMVEVNIPEYFPTTPKDGEKDVIVVPSGYFVNTNFPVTQSSLNVIHSMILPIQEGTIAPVRFKKGATFLLTYPSGKIESGYLTFLADV